MKILRSILGIVVGVVVAFVVVSVAQSAGHLVYPPPEEMKDPESFMKLMADPVELKRVVDELPTGAFVSVLVAWGCLLRPVDLQESYVPLAEVEDLVSHWLGPAQYLDRKKPTPGADAVLVAGSRDEATATTDHGAAEGEYQ